MTPGDHGNAPTATGAGDRPALPPLLLVIFDALRERGWTIDRRRGGYIDPEGNAHPSVEAAITVQTFREIGAAQPSEEP